MRGSIGAVVLARDGWHAPCTALTGAACSSRGVAVGAGAPGAWVRPSASTCSGRCGWSSTAGRSTCADPSAARCWRCSPWPRAAPSPSTSWSTPCGRPSRRNPRARPLHSHVSRLRGHLGPAAARLDHRSTAVTGCARRRRARPARGSACCATARATAHHRPGGGRRAAARGPGAVARAGPRRPRRGAAAAAAAAGLEQLRRRSPTRSSGARSTPGRSPEALGLGGGRGGGRPAARARGPAADARAGRDRPGAAGAAHRREFRRRLAEETGLDPSPALGALEQRRGGRHGRGPVRPRGARRSRRSRGRAARPSTR